MKRICALIVITLLSVPFFGKDVVQLKSQTIEGELFYPTKIMEGPDGNIYAADYKDYYIKVYSRDGNYLHRIGGKGEGPGQMKRMGSFGFSTDGKSLIFSEYFRGHKWLTFTGLNGEFKEVLNLNIDGTYGVLGIVMLPGGKFLLQINERRLKDIQKEGQYYKYYITKRLVIVNSSGEIETNIIRQRYVSSVSMVGNGSDITLPFQPAFIWADTGKGVIFTDGISPHLKIYNYKGDEKARILSPLPEPQTVTQDDLAKWKSRKLEVTKKHPRLLESLRGVLKLYNKSIFEHKPNVRSVSVTPIGNILVEGTFHEKDKTADYWLLNAQGESIFKAKLKAREVSIAKNFIFLLIVDDEGEGVFSILDRKGDEKADLLRLKESLR